MQCQEARTIFGPELGPRPISDETSNAFEHIQGCENCHRFYSNQRALADRVHRAGIAHAAPNTLRQQLLARLAEDDRKTVQVWSINRKPRNLLAVGALVAAAAAVVLTITWPQDTPVFAQPLVEQAMVALSNENSITSTDPKHLGEWLESQVGYHVHIPAIPRASLLGGRIATVGSTRTAAVIYTIDGNRLTYFAMGPGQSMDAEIEGQEIETVASGEHQIAFWTESGAGRAVVAVIPPADIAAVAEECRRQASAESAL